MNRNEAKRYYNTIKGRIAENISEEMFSVLGYNIERFGIENQFPSIIKLIRKHKNTASVKKIRNMPDFVIEGQNIGVRFLEVKYRFNGTITKEELFAYKEYPETIFVIYSKNQIYVTEIKDIEQNDDISRIVLSKLLKDSDIFKFSEEEKFRISCFSHLSRLFFENLERNDIAVEKIVC